MGKQILWCHSYKIRKVSLPLHTSKTIFTSCYPSHSTIIISWYPVTCYTQHRIACWQNAQYPLKFWTEKKNYIHSVKYHVSHCTGNLEHKINILHQIHKTTAHDTAKYICAMTEIIFMKQWEVITTQVTQVISGVGRPHIISAFM